GGRGARGGAGGLVVDGGERGAMLVAAFAGQGAVREVTGMAGQPGRVVIVGAGPAGMALAYLLARRGVGVTVLEAHQDFARAFRGEGVQRSGIDAFRQMGLGEPFDRLPHTAMKFVAVYSRGRR